MANIVRPGVVEKPWPYDRTWECDACGCVFWPGKGEFAVSEIKPEEGLDAKLIAIMECPQHGCHNIVSRYKYGD